MRRLAPLLSLVVVTACANPQVPDFMVEGRLPTFGDKGDKTEKPAPPPAKVAEAAPPPKPAEAPMPPPAAPAAPVASAPTVAPPAAPAPAVEPTPPQAMSEPAPKRSWFGHDKAQPQPPLAGGFSAVTDKATIQQVSAFAMDQAPNGYLLKSVKSIKSQVVAGTNYELCLRVRTPGHEASWIRQRLVKAVVWQHLDQTMELTSWNEVQECE
ncbi:MAG: hypothetical protein JF615_16600 [Asticcacaulis sp.]|nr:hypothetical protein [Asticcacaulis sp.]